ncbi:phage tail family protein [Lysinibacillus louembei]|uniref:Phage tail family protein n=1 Tax=Lysinibacillus louembei TaxID=1470088 RepID=A0ABZ0RWI6_9BACI|nr:distal tail protein Dit [Lysinibacillus louembei]WPK12597.1 phage tail family protein [Lysinibacillus louembei]
MIIELENGTRYDIANYSLKRLFHDIPSVEIAHTIQSVEGNGDIVTASNFKQRVITVRFLYIVQDIYDYYLLRDELNALFLQEKPFYIIFKREPYKRYKVRLMQQLSMEPSTHMNSFDVQFRMENLFAESVGTSLNLQSTKQWDADLWGWGMGIDWDKTYSYEHSSNHFSIENIGNALIDPRQHELEIIVKANAASYLQITNQTTGDVYKYGGTLTVNDTLVLKGIQTLKNGLSVFKETNKKLISLAPGQNIFTVEGGTIQSIAFNFRFLYM